MKYYQRGPDFDHVCPNCGNTILDLVNPMQSVNMWDGLDLWCKKCGAGIYVYPDDEI